MKGMSLFLFAFTFLLSILSISHSHCDTMDGPVIMDAKQALEKGDVTPVLKWIKRENESKIKDAFKTALKNRSKNDKAKQKADMRFFEILVMVHRAGEDAKFEGLKPEGTETPPILKAADKALESGSVSNLIDTVRIEISQGINDRFNEVKKKKKYMNDNVEAGRDYVKAYVEYVHYVEKLHMAGMKHSEHELEINNILHKKHPQ